MAKNHAYYSNTSMIDEAIRTLRTNLSFSSIDKQLQKIVITSSHPGEGKTTIALKLARSMAKNHQKVLLVDCDLRNPSIGKFMGTQFNLGLTNLLVKGLEFDQVKMKDSEESDLDIILTGPTPPNPSELLGSERMKSLLEKLETIYDVIILDTPPAGILTDAQVLSTMADGVLLVVAQGETKYEEIDVTLQNLKHVGANVLGTVLNKVEVKNKHKYGYGYGYGYKYRNSQS